MQQAEVENTSTNLLYVMRKECGKNCEDMGIQTAISGMQRKEESIPYMLE